MSKRNSESSEQIFDDIVNLCKENPRRAVILLVGKSGAGKSAFINTLYKAITGESHKIAKAGKGNTQTVTPKLVWYEHCGVEKLGLIKDEQRRIVISECLENLPNIIDFAGLGDVDDENTRVIFDRLLDVPVAETVLLTRYDELLYPTQNTSNQGINTINFEKCKKTIAEYFCFVEAAADNIVEWMNYSDSIQPRGQYLDNRKDVIDCNALRLLRGFLEPGVPIQHPKRNPLDWKMKCKIKAKHFGMEWAVAVVVVLCLLVLYFLIQAIMFNIDKRNSNTTDQ